MSRIRESEVSSPISLFPFIGILLCTMGALLVILVAVSRSAGDSAKREVSARQQAAAKPSKEDREKLHHIKRYVASLNTVKSAAESKIRDGQARLSHIEDHIRRLQEQLKSLNSAGQALATLEEQHFGDRRQAEQEVKRLEELAAETQTTIDSLREQAANEKHSYALVPYDGPNGTHRRPIYVECVNNEIILQPEGVKLSSDDLRPPFTAGNPLAAALRAARDHHVRLHPNEGQTRDTEPYPLLLVRPSGLLMYNRARSAIEAGDFDMGFELVENDWELKYPAADPTLLATEQQSIKQALARQEVLAQAAPRAYSHPGLAESGEFEFEDEGGGGFGSGGGGSGTYLVEGRSGGDGYGDGDEEGGGSSYGGDGGGAGGGDDGAPAYGTTRVSSNGGRGNGSGNGTPGGGDGSKGAGGSPVAVSESGGAGGGDSGDVSSDGISSAGGPGGSQYGGGGNAGGSGSGGGGRTGIAAMPYGSDSQDGAAMPATSDSQPGNVSVMTGSPPPESQPGLYNGRPTRGNEQVPGELAKSRGKDWALGKLPQRSTPIRRSIRVVVGDGQVAIMPDEDSTVRNLPAAEVVRFKGDTVESVDELVKRVHERVDSWGIAGSGLYWRPVLQLSNGPDGQRRAGDLSRLLKNSGLDVRMSETAQHVTGGQGYETR